jgi:hypothetical protein
MSDLRGTGANVRFGKVILVWVDSTPNGRDHTNRPGFQDRRKSLDGNSPKRLMLIDLEISRSTPHLEAKVDGVTDLSPSGPNRDPRYFCNALQRAFSVDMTQT